MSCHFLGRGKEREFGLDSKLILCPLPLQIHACSSASCNPRHISTLSPDPSVDLRFPLWDTLTRCFHTVLRNSVNFHSVLLTRDRGGKGSLFFLQQPHSPRRAPPPQGGVCRQVSIPPGTAIFVPDLAPQNSDRPNQRPVDKVQTPPAPEIVNRIDPATRANAAVLEPHS